MSYVKVPDRRIAFFDTDETIISHFPVVGGTAYEVMFNGVTRTIYSMPKNIDLISELRLCGYQIVVWSLSGADHAERMVNLLGLGELVDLIVSKPNLYVDDKPFEDQFIPRVYKK